MAEFSLYSLINALKKLRWLFIIKDGHVCYLILCFTRYGSDNKLS